MSGAVTSPDDTRSDIPSGWADRARLAPGSWPLQAASAVAMLAIAAAACSLPGPGAPVADKIRSANSPIVLEVRYTPSTFGGSSTTDFVKVVLTDAATEAQALDLWCTVIVPAGGDRLELYTLEVVQGEKEDPGGGFAGGDTIVPHPTTVDGNVTRGYPTCPPSPSGTPSP